MDLLSGVVSLRKRQGKIFSGLFVLLALGGLAVSAIAKQVEAEPAQVRVIDGDTLQVNGKVIQIFGIDAPELGQLCYHGNQPWACGLEAAFALHKLLELARGHLRCIPVSSRADDSAVCELDNEVIAEVLARQGHVVALADGVAEYREAEKAAKQAGLGIWGGEFVMPALWRAGERHVVAGSESERCNIKAVIQDGSRIYYVPLDPEYDSVKLNLARGDQLLCSDEQARRLGWRHVGAKASSN